MAKKISFFTLLAIFSMNFALAHAIPEQNLTQNITPEKRIAPLAPILTTVGSFALGILGDYIYDNFIKDPDQNDENQNYDYGAENMAR